MRHPIRLEDAGVADAIIFAEAESDAQIMQEADKRPLAAPFLYPLLGAKLLVFVIGEEVALRLHLDERVFDAHPAGGERGVDMRHLG